MNNKTQPDSPRRAQAIALAAIVMILVLGWIGFIIQKGLLTNEDEFRTAERSREMLLLGRSAVRENFQVSVVKPPLQYWLTTLSLPRFSKPEVAVRVWPLLYGVMTTIAVGFLAFRADRSRPWLIPLSIFVVLSCPLFLVETCGGRLDMGLACFATLAVLFAQLARKQPAWWLGVAVCAGLGALQKTPMVFLIWLILLLVRIFSPSERATLRSRWLALSLLLALGALAIWPLWQIAEFGMSIRDTLRLDEAIALAGPERLGAKPYFLVPFRVMTTWPAGTFAVAAALLLPRLLKNGARTLIVELSVVSLGLIFFLVIFNFRSVRYALPVIPLFSVLLAIFLCWFWEKRRRSFNWLFFIALLASLAGFEVSRRTIEGRQKNFADEKIMAETLGNLQEARRHTVLLEAQVGVYIPPVGLLPVPFYLFYGKLNFPVSNYTLTTFRGAGPKRPAIGVCDARHFPIVREKYPDAIVHLEQGQFICWRTPD